MNERRKADRYAFRMKASVQAVESRPLPIPIQTWTEDISGKGILLEFDEPIDVGARMNVLVELPAQVVGRPVTLRCISRVVRVHSASGKKSIGTTIESYEFIQPLASGRPN